MQLNNTLLTTIGVLLVLLLIVRYIPFGAYIRCLSSGVSISLLSLIFMRLRGVNASIIVNSLIFTKNEGVIVDPKFMESFYLAGGNVRNLTEGIVYAKMKNAQINIKLLAKAGLKHTNLIILIDRFLENQRQFGEDYSFEKLI